MFREMAPELEFSRWRDYPILWPKVFFSHVPSFPYCGAAQEKFFQENVWLSMDSPYMYVCVFVSGQKLYPRKLPSSKVEGEVNRASMNVTYFYRCHFWTSPGWFIHCVSTYSIRRTFLSCIVAVDSLF
jgi:hypothetical protein